MTQAQQNGTIIEPIYNGVNDRVAQVSAGVTTTLALDSASALPEVIYTSPSTSSGQAGNAYLHLPGLIMTESASGERRYLLGDGLGSVRQALAETGEVIVYHEFDPCGNPIQDGGRPYGNNGFLPDITAYQKNIFPNRLVGAWWMEREIRMFVGGEIGRRFLNYATPVGQFVEEAIGELWDFVHQP